MDSESSYVDCSSELEATNKKVESKPMKILAWMLMMMMMMVCAIQL
jgi:hypothetical protein